MGCRLLSLFDRQVEWFDISSKDVHASSSLIYHANTRIKYNGIAIIVKEHPPPPSHLIYLFYLYIHFLLYSPPNPFSKRRFTRCRLHLQQ